jgi:hypothetical protein
MRPPSFELDRQQMCIRARMSPEQRAVLEGLVRESRHASRPITILFVLAPEDPTRWLESSAQVFDVGDELYVVALPRCHIDRGCAVAERMVRLARNPEVRVGVAQVLNGAGGLDAVLDRAETALEDAVGAGPVASMHWADVSRDSLPAR